MGEPTVGLVTHPLRTGSQMVWSQDLCLKVTFEPLCSAGGCKHQTPALPWARALVAVSLIVVWGHLRCSPNSERDTSTS